MEWIKRSFRNTYVNRLNFISKLLSDFDFSTSNHEKTYFPSCTKVRAALFNKKYVICLCL